KIGYTNARGVPVVAVAIVTLCSCLSLITIFVGSGVVFQWFVSIIGSIIFQSWILIIGCGCIIATCYLSVINPPQYPGADATAEALAQYSKDRDGYAQGLLGAWFPWVLSAILFFSYKYSRGTKMIKAVDADLDTGRFIPSESDKEDLKPHGPKWKRVLKSLV
ncbi:hypothetical protein BGZ89_004283, partial [Linnemannia elongata]